DEGVLAQIGEHALASVGHREVVMRGPAIQPLEHALAQLVEALARARGDAERLRLAAPAACAIRSDAPWLAPRLDVRREAQALSFDHALRRDRVPLVEDEPRLLLATDVAKDALHDADLRLCVFRARVHDVKEKVRVPR